jgi:magnesium transporter
MTPKPEHLDEPILKFARTDFTLLKHDWTVNEALKVIREKGVGEKIVYFYVVDARDALVGVLPTRRLLMTPLEKRLDEIMIQRVVTIPHTATVMEACELFTLHKFFAFPIVDEQHRVIGLVDVGLFTEEVFDIAEREQLEDVFEAIGFRVSQVRDASPLKAYRYRFPWLLVTIGTGSVCALMAGAFEETLKTSIVIAFFLTLVLALSESVSIQSMTVTIQAFRVMQPTLRWYLGALRREIVTAALIGSCSGALVGLIVFVWRGEPMAALAIGMSILLTTSMACLFGLSVPSLLHALKLDPKIAAGPVTLALTDIFTLLVYFTLGTVLLGK